MKPEQIRDIVVTVLNNHPKECVFAPGAIDYVVRAYTKGYGTCKTEDDTITLLERLIRSQEIYCPHENIDKRDQFKPFGGTRHA